MSCNLQKTIDFQLNKRRLVKTGHCLSCGKCCEGNVKVYEIADDTINLMRKQNKPCFYYDEKTKKCKVYNDRNEWCYLFPYLPEVLFEGCGYGFITKDTDNENNGI